MVRRMTHLHPCCRPDADIVLLVALRQEGVQVGAWDTLITHPGPVGTGVINGAVDV